MAGVAENPSQVRSRRGRRSLLLAGALLLASLLVTLLVVLYKANSDDSEAAASCIGPLLTSTSDASHFNPDQVPTLGDVRRGTEVVVYGHYFYRDCHDTVSAGQSGPEKSAPIKSITLTFTDGSIHKNVATVAPDQNGALSAHFLIPADAPVGDAVLSAGTLASIKLVIK